MLFFIGTPKSYKNPSLQVVKNKFHSRWFWVGKNPDSAHKRNIFFQKPFDPFILCFLRQETYMACMQEKNCANCWLGCDCNQWSYIPTTPHPNVPPRNHATATASAGFPITKLEINPLAHGWVKKADISQQKNIEKTPQICIISTWFF